MTKMAIKEIQPVTSSPEFQVPDAVPAGADHFSILVPFVLSGLAFAARSVVQAIAEKRAARQEEISDMREYLQQQNEMLLKELLDQVQEQEPN